MHIEGGANAAYRREIEEADDPAAKKAEIEGRLRELASAMCPERGDTQPWERPRA